MKIVPAKELPPSFFDPPQTDSGEIVRKILAAVRREGDAAVRRYTRRFDKVVQPEIRIALPAMSRLKKEVPLRLRRAVQKAAANIGRFAAAQRKQFKDFELEIEPGVFCGQKVIPIDRIGIYVPGGNYPLISSLLMGVIPAQVAGVGEIAVCSPPTYNNSLPPALLYALAYLGLDEIYAIGGVQAIGAMTFGTRTVKRVDKIVGPGNKYVALAKKEVYGAVGIDFVAGPTEVAVIADSTADAKLVAADLIAQAEHDLDARPTLITTDRDMADKVNEEIKKQLRKLPTARIARRALADHGIIVLTEDLTAAVALCNDKAPEHVELQVTNPQELVGQLRNYGSLFIDKHAAEALGDYSSGLNHTLPTGRASRYSGGLSVRDFLKLQTTLRVEARGLKRIGPAARILAEAEGLAGHARSVSLRLKNPSPRKKIDQNGA